MIAIDFGTSRIKLAYLDSISGEAKMMQLNQGNDPSEPSLFYMGPDGEREYGHFAEEYLETDPKGVVDTLKRKLRKPHIRANRQKATPHELLSHMFSDLRRRATDELPHLLGKAPKDVVLTFPARFGPAEEDILRESAKAAGFTEVILVSEPEAAARAWARFGSYR